jgi:guanine deaminase
VSDAPPSRRTCAVRGGLVYCRDDPFLTDPAKALVHEADGLVVCRDGVIVASGAFSELMAQLPSNTIIDDHTGCLIAPGFVDTHVHYVQTGMIGSQGKQLLDWLERYTFPAEQAFADPQVAAATAELFCDELLRNGTTTALVFCSVHPVSVDALFEAAARRNLLLIAGKVLMDRNVPETLRDTAQSGYDQSKALIAKWHGRGRALYAITPRFAGSSTPAQLEAARALWREHAGVFMQSHIAENIREVAWIKELYPERRDYLDVYAHYGLIGKRSLYAHGIYLDESELQRCHESTTALAHCPTSNNFLGSGLFHLRNARDRRRPVEVGLGSDVGAGTTFSLIATMGEAYKVSQLAQAPIDAVEAFYVATLGGARALALEGRIGSLAAGHDADMVVLDSKATPLMAFRSARAQSVQEELAVLMTLGDDRAVRATYVAGERARVRGAGARQAGAGSVTESAS